MKSGIRSELIKNAAWLGGVAILLVGVVSIGAMRLGARQDRVSELRGEVQFKPAALAARPELAGEMDRLQTVDEQLADWGEMVDVEGQRIAELVGVAREAGVRITSLSNADAEHSEDGAVTRASHEVEGVGEYRDIAAFLDGVYGARGLAGVDEVHIGPDDTPGSRLLQTSLLVTWYAEGPGEPVSEGSTP